VRDHIDTKKTSAYDTAVTLLTELRDAYTHTGREAEFHTCLTHLRDDYQRRPALMQRLDYRGLR
jgi:uncharacterized Zn finger protein